MAYAFPETRPLLPRRVLVTDARLSSGVAMIRSLGRRGFHVTAADSHRLSAGFYSRYASDRLLYPPPASAPDQVVEALLDAVHKRGIELIFPVTDEIVLPLARDRGRFESIAILALPSADALRSTIDKASTTLLAESLGIPTPRTALVETADEACEVANTLGWPIVIKPQASRALEPGGVRAFGVTYANDLDELAQRMNVLAGRSRALLQEYCGGEARGVGILADGGETLSAFQYRRLREVPVTGGPSSLRESVQLETPHFHHAVRLIEALQWTGLAMVEFKGDASNPKLMEVNGRIWGSLALAVKSGVDFPARAASLYFGEPVPPDLAGYAVGVRSRDLRLEMSWIAAALMGKRTYAYLPWPKRRAGLKALARLASARDGFDVLSINDPLPGVVEVLGLGPRVYRRRQRRRAGSAAMRDGQRR